MKNFKKVTLGVLGAVLLTTGLYSCSSDNVESNINEPTSFARPGHGVIQKFYGTELSVLKTLEVKDDFGNYMFVKYDNILDTTVDIYSLTDVKGEIEYLIEFDHKYKLIKSTNVFTDEVVLIENVDEIPKLEFFKYDLIDASKAILADFPVFNGDRFWGWACEPDVIETNPLNGEQISCERTCSHSVFGTKGKHKTFKCDDKNGPQSYKLVRELR